MFRASAHLPNAGSMIRRWALPGFTVGQENNELPSSGAANPFADSLTWGSFVGGASGARVWVRSGC